MHEKRNIWLTNPGKLWDFRAQKCQKIKGLYHFPLIVNRPQTFANRASGLKGMRGNFKPEVIKSTICLNL
jgi:hypothetical protein